MRSHGGWTACGGGATRDWEAAGRGRGSPRGSRTGFGRPWVYEYRSADWLKFDQAVPRDVGTRYTLSGDAWCHLRRLGKKSNACACIRGETAATHAFKDPMSGTIGDAATATARDCLELGPTSRCRVSTPRNHPYMVDDGYVLRAAWPSRALVEPSPDPPLFAPFFVGACGARPRVGERCNRHNRCEFPPQNSGFVSLYFPSIYVDSKSTSPPFPPRPVSLSPSRTATFKR